MENKNLFQNTNIYYEERTKKKKRFKKRFVAKSLFSKKRILCYSLIIILYTIFVICLAFIIIRKRNSSREERLKTKNKEIKIELLKHLTNNNKTLYEGVERCLEKDPDEELCLYQFLCPKEVINKTRVLMGFKFDGSYVMLDDFDNIKIAYSIGIDGEIQFDKALADKGIDIYMYDHTIKRLPYENEKFHWKKIGIGGNADKASDIQTLTDMMKDNGHLNEKNMILKMDVEGPEWKSLNDISEEVLKQFKYILIEYHFFTIEPQLFYNVLKKIYKTHQVFYVHCCEDPNVKTFGNNRFCNAIEVSYIIRDGYSFAKDKSIYPIEGLAYANHKGFNVNILKLFDDYGKI